ncbi:MAG: ABC transporter ATP-binding protein/permease, partial [Candidatus Pacebacteria bacterium]|nr:ABC transporter ATP-binding protein/permease [Candidatus Paceibacterota bacterium]
MQKTVDTIPTTPYRFALYASKPFWPWASLSVVLVVVGGFIDTSIYYVFKQLVDTTAAFTAGEVSIGVVMLWVAAYPVAQIGSQLIYRLSSLSIMQWLTATRSYAANQLFRYLSLHSVPYFNDRFAGSLSNKIWNASGGVQGMYETAMWGYLNTLAAFISSAFLVGTVSLTLAALFVAWILLLVVINRYLSVYTAKYSEERAAYRSKMSGVVVDIVTNMLSVKNFARRNAEVDRVASGMEELRKYSVRSWFYNEMLLLFNNVLMGLFAVSMIVSAYWLWSTGAMTNGELVMILTILNGIMGWFAFIGSSMNQFAERYGEVREGLNEIMVPHGIADAGAQVLTATRGEVRFNNVTFAYGEGAVFTDFNLTIPHGQRVGLVGPSGSGKTTFVSLLLRQHEVGAGSITIDGTDIRTVSQDSLHEVVAVVPQEPSLFHRTLRENISYGRPDATQDDIEAAARKAQAHEFIVATPDGYQTMVGERGVKLSGGQRQRVAIARAILKAAPILVLDEATSSLDSESEAAIQVALKELMQGKTVIAIAHRLSTIREMDRIIVMEGG